MATGRDKQNNKKVTKVTCCLGDYHSDGKVTGEAASSVFKEEGSVQMPGLKIVCLSVYVCMKGP